MADTEVLIVGAGPVGLTAALKLRRRGVGCRVIDRLAGPVPYAKAGIQPRTLELWEAAGVLTRALDAATPMHGQILFVNRKQVGRIELALPPDVPYGFVALPQYETERLLADRLAELGGRVERGVELVRFTQDTDGVTAVLRGPDGQTQVRAAYLVGCDGAHSAVRKGLGLEFAGDARSTCSAMCSSTGTCRRATASGRCTRSTGPPTTCSGGRQAPRPGRPAARPPRRSRPAPAGPWPPAAAVGAAAAPGQPRPRPPRGTTGARSRVRRGPRRHVLVRLDGIERATQARQHNRAYLVAGVR